MIELITPVDGHAEMPDEPFKPLSDVEIDMIRRWIAAGAENDAPEDTGPRYDCRTSAGLRRRPSLPSVDVSPDGSLLAVAGFHEVILLDAETGEQRSRLVGMSPRINTVRFSPDGKRLAAVGGTPAVRGEVQIWEVEQWRTGFVTTGDLRRTARWQLVARRQQACLRRVGQRGPRDRRRQTGEQVLFQGAHDDWVRDTAFTPDGKHLISVARDMSCKLTEVETERFIDNITSITPGALSGGISSVVAHPAAKRDSRRRCRRDRQGLSRLSRDGTKDR